MWHIKYSLIYIYIYISNLHIFSQCYCNFLALLLFALFFFFFFLGWSEFTKTSSNRRCSVLFPFVLFHLFSLYLSTINIYASPCMAEGTAMKNCSRITTTPSCYIIPKIKTPFYIYIYIYINHQLYHSKPPP